MINTGLKGDGECTWSPDGMLGYDFIACCVQHDLSDFTLQDDLALGECIADLATDPISYAVLAIVGGVYFIGTRVYRIIKVRYNGEKR